MSNEKLRICFVSMRYGSEVTGGAEYLCRLIAEQMTKYYDISVITTKAKDYLTWKDYYSSSHEVINNVKIHRFSVDFSRDIIKFNKLSEEVFLKEHNFETETEWMKTQGPYSTSLFNYIKESKDKYDLFIFIGYLYATTYYGLPLVKDKAILLPTIHNEEPAYLDIFKSVYKSPKGIIFNTPEEKKFMFDNFYNQDIPNEVIAVGMDKKTFCIKNIDEDKVNPYIIYIGRIEAGKGAHELFNFFDRYKKQNPIKISLFLLGSKIMDIPVRKDINFLGFVSEDKKYEFIKKSTLLINPSKQESLSLILLEAWKAGKPVLVNSRSEVLKGQVIRAQGGLYYEDYEEFEAMLNWLIEHPKERKIMGGNGKKYVDLNYSWDIIEKKLVNFINSIVKNLKKSN